MPAQLLLHAGTQQADQQSTHRGCSTKSPAQPNSATAPKHIPHTHAHLLLSMTIMLVGHGRLFQCTNRGACGGGDKDLEEQRVWDEEERQVGAKQNSCAC